MSAMEFELDPRAGRPTTAAGTAALQYEETISTVALLGIVVLPLAEIVLRRFAGLGISGSSTLVQHLTLVISMLGAALAARDSRLLSLATSTFLPERFRESASIVSSIIASAITGFLAAASVMFVNAERMNGKALAYSLPLWIVQSILPIGFLVIALRIVWTSSKRWPARAVVFTSAGCIVLLAPHAPFDLTTASLVALFLAALLGAPVFVILGGLALILFHHAGVPIAAVTVDHYSLVVNPSLPAIPLFTLAGYLLAEGGASTRLVGVFTTLFGRVRGGPAIITALACAFFTSFTGGSGVTILALGGLLLPLLQKSGYSEKSALGMITGAGSLGLLFPPCLPLILYAIVAQVRMEQIFLGGIAPGILLVALTAWWGKRQDMSPRTTEPFNWTSVRRAIWIAKWELALPFVVVGVLFGGFATPVETAAFTALYAFIVQVFIHRDFDSFRKLTHVFSETALLVGGVTLILGVALGFTNYLIDAEIPAHMVDWVTASVHSRFVFLLLLNMFLLVVGCLMDIFSAIVVVVPLIVPLGTAFNIDPIHLGIIFLSNLELGYLTPPVGMNLFISSIRFRKPMSEVVRATLPMLIVLLIGVLLITYVSPLTTFLPSQLAR